MSSVTLVLRACAVVCLAREMTLQADVEVETNMAATATEAPRKEALITDSRMYTVDPEAGGLENGPGFIRVKARCKDDILKTEGQRGKVNWNVTQHRSFSGEIEKRQPRKPSFRNGFDMIRYFQESLTGFLVRRGKFRGDLGKRFSKIAVGEIPNRINLKPLRKPAKN